MEDEIVVNKMHYTRERGFEMEAKHPLFARLIQEMVDFFRESGGENFVELRAYHKETGPLVLTIKKECGKTPGQIIDELRKQINAIDAKAPNPKPSGPPRGSASAASLGEDEDGGVAS